MIISQGKGSNPPINPANEKLETNNCYFLCFDCGEILEYVFREKAIAAANNHKRKNPTHDVRHGVHTRIAKGKKEWRIRRIRGRKQ